jgi:hypothetical protein
LRRFQLHRAAQKRTKARKELAKFEWFSKVIVGTVIEAGNAVVDAVARGKHQYRHFQSGPAKLAANFKAAESREHDVQDDQVVGINFGLLECLRAGGDSVDGVRLLLQTLNHKSLHAEIVFCK